MQFNKYKNLAKIEKYNRSRIDNNFKVILFVFDFAIGKPVILNSLYSILASRIFI